MLLGPGSVTAREQALELLEKWDHAHSRLTESADEEVLHDFRVALRRLESLLRAFRKCGDPLVPRSVWRQLQRLSRATGAARDLEVHRNWLHARLPDLTPGQRPEGRWLATRIDRRHAKATARLLRRLSRRYDPLYERARTALQRIPTEPGAAAAGAVVGGTLLDWTSRLEHRLAGVHTLKDQAEAHRARIVVKRVRYLLEPFHDGGADAILGQLKALQDILGDLHDRARLAAVLRRGFRDIAVDHAERRYRELLPWSESPNPHAPAAPVATGGVAALARRVGAEAELLFSRLEHEWLKAPAAAELCELLRQAGRTMIGENA
jgi:CHAD domain-containing protein